MGALSEPPPKVSEDVPGLPPAFDDVVARALAKEPARPLPSAGDLGRAALAAAGLAGRDPLERSVAPAPRRGTGRHGGPGEGATIPLGGPRSPTPTPVHETPPTATVGGAGAPSRRRGLLIGAIAGRARRRRRRAGDRARRGWRRRRRRSSSARRRRPRRRQAPQRSPSAGGRTASRWPAAWRGSCATPSDPGDGRHGTGRSGPLHAGRRGRAVRDRGGLRQGLGGQPRAGPADPDRRGGPIARTARRHRCRPGRPVSVAADSRWIWVGLRSFGGASLVKIDPGSRRSCRRSRCPTACRRSPPAAAPSGCASATSARCAGSTRGPERRRDRRRPRRQRHRLRRGRGLGDQQRRRHGDEHRRRHPRDDADRRRRAAGGIAVERRLGLGGRRGRHDGDADRRLRRREPIPDRRAAGRCAEPLCGRGRRRARVGHEPARGPPSRASRHREADRQLCIMHLCRMQLCHMTPTTRSASAPSRSTRRSPTATPSSPS